jgi:hypothetical protein
MHCLRSLGSRDRGFESHSGHGCLVFVSGRDLSTSWSLRDLIADLLEIFQIKFSRLCISYFLLTCYVSHPPHSLFYYHVVYSWFMLQRCQCLRLYSVEWWRGCSLMNRKEFRNDVVIACSRKYSEIRLKRLRKTTETLSQDCPSPIRTEHHLNTSLQN